MNLLQIEVQLANKVQEITSLHVDPAHDYLHFKRVVATSKFLCTQEQARLEVVLPAAWLHDLVIVDRKSVV